MPACPVIALLCLDEFARRPRRHFVFTIELFVVIENIRRRIGLVPLARSLPEASPASGFLPRR